MSNKYLMNVVRRRSMFLIIGFIPLFLVACNSEQPTQQVKQTNTVWDLVSVPVLQKSLAVNYRTTGSVVSDQRIDVASRTSGYIREILVREGVSVKKGEPLLMLDGANVEGAINQALAAVNKSKSALKDAQTDLMRFEALFKRGSVSDNKVRKIRLQRDVARDTLSEAKAGLKTANSQRQYTQITSPIDGVVVERYKREGDLAAPGVPLLTVESNEGLLFETYIAEGQLGKLKEGDTLNVEVDALNEKVAGVIARIVPSGNPLTRKSRVKISLSAVPGLLPGMFGRAHFEVGKKMRPIVQQLSVVRRGGLDGVFVVDEHNTAHFRWLQFGEVIGESIEVLAGLSEGELILAKPDNRVREGDAIMKKGVASE